MLAQRVVGLAEADQVDRDQLGALVDQLVEAVLAVGARLAPVDRPGVVVDRRRRRASRACRWTPSSAAGGRRGSASGTGRRASRRPSGRRRNRGTRPPAGPSARAGSARTARCGSARPSRGSRRAARRSCRRRSRASSRGRWPSPSSSGRRPSPRTRTCCRCRCRTPTRPAALVETATKCLATAASSPSARAPTAAPRRVGHRLERRERLRGDDEERLLGVEVAGRLDEVGRVDVRHEPEGHVALAVVAKRLVGHHGAEIGAADADVDDVCGSACRCGPSTRPSARAARTPPSGRAPGAPAGTRPRRRRSATPSAAGAAPCAAPSGPPRR